MPLTRPVRTVLIVLSLLTLAGLLSSVRAADTDTGPRDAKYDILSYGNISNPLHLGYIVLDKGTYQYLQNGGKLIGTGKYTYDATTTTVTWVDGPLKENMWRGAFTIEREGKTHKIRLNRVTIAVHSTDAK